MRTAECQVCLRPDCDVKHVDCSPPRPRTAATAVGAPRPPRHTSATLALALSMYGEGDAWTPTQIARYLADHGTIVSVATVRDWVVPGVAEKRRQAQNARTQERARRRAAGMPPAPAPTPLLDRMRQLHDAGIPRRHIGIVLGIDEGLQLSAGQVCYYLETGREPVLPKRRARKKDRAAA